MQIGGLTKMGGEIRVPESLVEGGWEGCFWLQVKAVKERG